MVTKAITAATVGINAFKIEVEVDVANSLPNICIVGLPDSSVNEAKTATAIVAVYDSFGRLSETVYVSKNIPALADETIAAGMTIPAELEGGKVKMFLWNNVNTMQPYTKAITATIAAAE